MIYGGRYQRMNITVFVPTADNPASTKASNFRFLNKLGNKNAEINSVLVCLSIIPDKHARPSNCQNALIAKSTTNDKKLSYGTNREIYSHGNKEMDWAIGSKFRHHNR